jgi:hypothetical protein
VEDEKRAIETKTFCLDQKLANYLRYKEYGKALKIALQVDKRMHVWKVITVIIENDMKKNKATGLVAMQPHAQCSANPQVLPRLEYTGPQFPGCHDGDQGGCDQYTSRQTGQCQWRPRDLGRDHWQEVGRWHRN